jgi:hypothetical protein
MTVESDSVKEFKEKRYKELYAAMLRVHPHWTEDHAAKAAAELLNLPTLESTIIKLNAKNNS